MEDVFKEAEQKELPGLSDLKVKTTDLDIQIPDDDRDDNMPFIPQHEVETQKQVLNRSDPTVSEFAINARIQLYYFLEKQAHENGKLDAFRRAVGDSSNFADINKAYPIASENDEEGKKNDPYYNHPVKYSKGIKTYTKEIVNTGKEFLWEVTQIITKVQGGKDLTDWEFKNISNPKYN